MAVSGSFSKSVCDGHYKLRIDWTAAQSVADNTSTITAKAYLVNDWRLNVGSRSGYITINGTKYSFTSKSINGTSTEASPTLLGTVTSDPIAHNEDGTQTISLSASWSMQATINDYGYIGSINASASTALDAISRLSVLKVGQYKWTLGTAATLTIDRFDNTFTHSITYECGTASGTICTKSTAASISFTPPLSLANQAPSGTSVYITLKIETFDASGNSLGSSLKSNYGLIPDSVAPSCSMTITDAMGYYNTFGGYIQNRSKLNIVVTPAIAYGSPIDLYQVAFEGSVYSGATITTNALKASANTTAITTVTDSRGRSGSATANIPVLAYSAPVISKLSVRRCNQDGTENINGEYTQITFSANVTALSNKNTASYKVKYRQTSANNSNAYTEVEIGALNNVYSVTNKGIIIPTDSGHPYDIIIVAEDFFSESTKSTSVSTGFALMHFNAEGNAIAFGKIAEEVNAVEFGLEAFFQNDLHCQQLIYDKFEQLINNGLAEYTGTGAAAIDPDTTLQHLIVTDKNTPTSNFYFVLTLFYSSKTNDANKTQLAIPYSVGASTIYYRTKASGTWSDWKAFPMIVEQGESGIWSYEKWADGKAKLVGKLPITGSNINIAMGALYRNGGAYSKENYKFPFSFIEKPVCHMDYKSTNGNGAWVWFTAECYVDMLPDIYLVRHSSVTGSVGVIDIIIEGKWR